MERNLKVGDLVYTEDAMDYPEGLFAIIVDMETFGEGEERRYNVDVMFDNTEEDWGITEIEWNDDLGAWTFYWG